MTAKSVFICQNCGYHSPKWVGRCSSCGQWNTMIEEIEEEVKGEYSFPPSEPVLYDSIQEAETQRIASRTREFDRVLGGGIVLGSLVLIGGEPGVGKSTLLLQVTREISSLGKKILYVSGEESLEQIKIRGDRLGLKGEKIYLLAETNMERIITQADKLSPDVLVIDSVQTVFSSKLSSSPGTISQVREVANQVFRFAKKNQVASFLVGHITKEGSLAGPKSLEHMVDVVLYFEGERDHTHRVLRAFKNRFGPVSEIAIFEMSGRGLKPVANPSAFFLKERPAGEAGSVVVCTIKGSRPLLAEIQALVSPTLFTGNPRRMTVGLDHFRTAMLMAIVERKLGYSFAGEDIYFNVAGGLAVDEPAVDLGVVVAALSCLKNKAVSSDLSLFGEVGLSGEVRSVSQAAARIKEASSLGFKTVIMPQGNIASLDKKERERVECVGVENLKQALNYIF
ncbi:MAG: DNA repair protein RadA [Candidatus Aminicenantales bacterium]